MHSEQGAEEPWGLSPPYASSKSPVPSALKVMFFQSPSPCRHTCGVLGVPFIPAPGLSVWENTFTFHLAPSGVLCPAGTPLPWCSWGSLHREAVMR